ncbi:MAG: hypothetical protein D6734_10190 [Candidatus Schekmanbacteria bacterium]|nr:MAG: hypothetical protein D6734_10190 [Candidatus Schekmanbacteria bacterium]
MTYKDIEKIASSVVGGLFAPRSAHAGIEGCSGAQDSNPFACDPQTNFGCSNTYQCGGAAPFDCSGGGTFQCSPVFDCAGGIFSCDAGFECFQQFTAA